ncbi:MAG: hypothetical protein ACNA8L_00300 [Luteolibacter sp.]|jgi:hypothetical protein
MRTTPNKDDVERLSRGQSTRAKIGNRRIGHRLTLKERQLFEAAQRQGFLKIPVSGIRPNVLNVYRLWCVAEGREFRVKGGPPPNASHSN